MDISCLRFRTIIIIVLLAFPLLVFGQKNPEDYTIYSKYLKIYQDNKKAKLSYVIRVSTDYGKKSYGSDIGDILQEIRGYLKGDKSDGSAFFRFEAFKDTLKSDTLWLPLMTRLQERMKHEYRIQNQFSNNLQITMLTYNHYIEYFDKTNSRDIDNGWASFHEDYPDKPLLINLSEIVNDGKRAVFYFSSQCGGLCGVGQLVLFYKDKSEWRFVLVIPMWES